MIKKGNLQTKKKKPRIDLEKLTDAVKAGTKDSHKCTLIISEGDTANSTALFISKHLEGGVDYYGCMPIT